MSEQKTVDPVRQSYEVNSLLTVCIASLLSLEEATDAPHNRLAGSLRETLEIAQEKWGECHDALEEAEKASETAAQEGKP